MSLVTSSQADTNLAQRDSSPTELCQAHIKNYELEVLSRRQLLTEFSGLLAGIEPSYQPGHGYHRQRIFMNPGSNFDRGNSKDLFGDLVLMEMPSTDSKSGLAFYIGETGVAFGFGMYVSVDAIRSNQSIEGDLFTAWDALAVLRDRAKSDENRKQAA